MVVYACSVGNGDAHLKNFSVLYRHVEDTVELSPAYDMVSTLLYFPRDSLALTLGGTKEFPQRATLLKFVRLVTGKTEKAAAHLLDQARAGVEAAISEAREYGKQYADAGVFVNHLVRIMRGGLQRLAA
jgi:serine/threonine-protein kinase HipA